MTTTVPSPADGASLQLGPAFLPTPAPQPRGWPRWPWSAVSYHVQLAGRGRGVLNWAALGMRPPGADLPGCPSIAQRKLSCLSAHLLPQW